LFGGGISFLNIKIKMNVRINLEYINCLDQRFVFILLFLPPPPPPLHQAEAESLGVDDM